MNKLFNPEQQPAAILASMTPAMVRTLRAVDVNPDVQVHGPILKALMVRGLVRHSRNRLVVTWAGQKVLNEVAA